MLGENTLLIRHKKRNEKEHAALYKEAIKNQQNGVLLTEDQKGALERQAKIEKSVEEYLGYPEGYFTSEASSRKSSCTLF